tara:strand:- start:5074 stop:5955 length:882 start_codon:yes stop_codon:yes gene_type:complete
MSAHTVEQNTVIGFVNGLDLYYVTSNYDVKHLDTDQLVATNVTNEGEVQQCTFGNPVYGRDIADGISMTVRTRNNKLNTNTGIAITEVRVGSYGWSVCEHLPTHQAMLLMSKWFMEHGMMELYQKQCNMAPNKAFLEWVTGKNIKFFPKNGKLQWYSNAMSIDYEMELRKCSFEECLCNKTVPSGNKRHIIPHEYYDDFGLYNSTERNRLWMEGKPNTEEEANLILHMARFKEFSDDLSTLMTKIRLDAEQQRIREAAHRDRVRETYHKEIAAAEQYLQTQRGTKEVPLRSSD